MAFGREKRLKPVPLIVHKIVRDLAKSRTVENLVLSVTHHSCIKGELSDLTQIIYLALLQTEATRLQHLSSSGDLKFYIVRMIQNQYFSKNSPFYTEIRKFSDRTSEISTQISETYDADKDYYNR